MRKLKDSFIMFLILFNFLLLTLLGVYFTRDKEEIIEEEEIQEITTFKGDIKSDVKLEEDIEKLICDYLDAYFFSLYDYRLADTKKYFLNEMDGLISDYAINLIVESHKLYDYDLSISNGHYDLNFLEVTYYNDEYHLTFLEDDYLNFRFTNGLTSECLDIENYMVIKKVDDEYKIVDHDKVQGYYMMFYENKPEDINELDALYDYYYKQLKNSVENENFLKEKAAGQTYLTDKSFDLVYDRNKAVSYADKYYHLRNNIYYDFSDEGGNCQNYASQCIYQGIKMMDYDGEYQWKCYMKDGQYDPGVNDNDEESGRSISWVHVSSFRDYCLNNKGFGLVSDTEANLFYGEVGDIVQVGISSISHTTIISKVIDGHILVNSNSIDMKDWPLDAYTYPTKKLIKILGFNE